MTNTRSSLPIIVELPTDPFGSKLQFRTLLRNRDMTVAAFAQDFLSNRRPDWLPVIANANMKSANSSSTNISALIKFGDNENDFQVNIQQQQNGDSKKIKSITIGLCLLLSEESNDPIKVIPNGNHIFMVSVFQLYLNIYKYY